MNNIKKLMALMSLLLAVGVTTITFVNAQDTSENVEVLNTYKLVVKTESTKLETSYEAKDELSAELYFRNYVNENGLKNLHWYFDTKSKTFTAYDSIESVSNEEWIDELDKETLNEEWIDELNDSELKEEWVDELNNATLKEEWIEEIAPEVITEDLTPTTIATTEAKTTEKVETVSEWVEELAPKVVEEDLTPTTQAETTKPNNVVVVTSESVEKATLPNTGEHSTFLFNVLVVVMIVLGDFIVFGKQEV